MSVDTSSSPTEPEPEPAPVRKNYAWHPSSNRGRMVSSRRMRRSIVTVGLLGLLALLTWLIVEPFLNPQVHLFFLSGGDYHALQAPPVMFVSEDYAALKGLDKVLSPHDGKSGPRILSNLRNPTAMESLAEKLVADDSTSSQVLIIDLSAHGVAIDGAGYLLTRNFDPTNPALGRYELRQLLTQLVTIRAKTKLLVLDACRVISDPRWGVVADEFPRLLQQAVHETGDPTLWVLSSNSLNEASQVSPSLERSVFGYFTTRGLQGAADLDGDRLVNLTELYRYVSANVVQWTLETTGGLTTQTPVLLWGGEEGGSRIPETPLLASAGLRDREDEIHASIVVAQKKSRTAPLRNVQESRIGGHVAHRAESRLENRIDAAAGDVISSVREAKGQLEEFGLVPSQESEPEEPKATGAGEKKSTENPPADGKPIGDAAGEDKSQPANGARETGAKTESANGAKPAGATGGAAAKPNGSPTAKPASTGKPTVPQLLEQGWQLRDKLVDPHYPHPRPCVVAPQIWRQFLVWMVDQETLYLAGKIGDEEEIAAALRNELEGLAKLPNPPPFDERIKLPQFAARIAKAYWIDPSDVTDPRSLALALALNHGATPVSPELQATRVALDNFCFGGERTAFEKWAAALPVEYDRFSEIRLARQLARLTRIDWTVVQLALETRTISEKLAADRMTLPWIFERIEAGDRLRIAGERKLLDRIGRDRQEQAGRLLRQAQYVYREAAADRDIIHSSNRVAHDLLARLPFYLTWFDEAGPEGNGIAPKFGELVQLFELLEQLQLLFEARRPADLAKLKKTAADIDALRSHIELGLGTYMIEELTTLPAAPGDNLRIAGLLATPLADATCRLQLLAGLAVVDGDLASRVHPAKIPRTPQLPRTMTGRDWKFLAEQAELQSRLVHVASPQGSGQSALAQQVRSADEELAELTATRLTSSNATTGDDDLWLAYRTLGSAVEHFWRELPTLAEAAVDQNRDLQFPASRARRFRGLHYAERSLRLMNAVDVVRLEPIYPSNLIMQAELYDLLLWQRERLLAAQSDAPPQDFVYLADSATSYLHQANGIPRQPKAIAEPSPQLQLDGPQQIDLTTRSEEEVRITAVLRGAHVENTWVVLDYDPELVEVVASSTGIYHEPQLRASKPTTADGQITEYPFRPDLADLPPSFQLHPGIAETFRLRIRGRVPSPQAASVMVKAVAEKPVVPDAANSARSPFSRSLASLADCNYVRHEIEVTLPVPEMVEIAVAGSSGSWSPTEDGAVLNVFPNQITSYSLSLFNRGGQDRSVDVELFAVGQPRPNVLPPGALPAADAAAILARYAPLTPLANLPKVLVPTGGSHIALPFPAPPGPPKPKPKAGDKGAPAELPAAALLPRTSVQDGLLMVITDGDTQLKTIKRLTIAPQRPRRYIRPRVSYDVDSEQIRIRLTPQDKSLLPPDGAKIHAEIVEPLPPGTESQLDGELKAPQYEANLFVKVPSDDSRTLTLRLHVDDFPRAFVYRVPIGVQALDIPEELDLREIRIQSPKAGKVYTAPIGSIPVEFQVDAPAHTRQPIVGLVEIGVDADRDRDLRDENTIELSYDRQVTALLDGLAPGGKISIDAIVTDFTLDLPAPNTLGAKVDLLGRVSAEGKSAYSQATQVIIDGTPPAITRLELIPAGIVKLGDDLEVDVWATDNDLSGVSRVEAMFDLLGTGKFEGGMPVAASQEDDGRWVAKLKSAPLLPGPAKVLVRATDRADNVSKIESARLRVVTPEEASTQFDVRNTITGSVVFGGQPVPDAKVSIEVAQGQEPIAPVVTPAAGTFVFNKVPPGNYRISVVALIHNKNRRQTADVVVEPSPARVPSVRILLK